MRRSGEAAAHLFSRFSAWVPPAGKRLPLEQQRDILRSVFALTPAFDAGAWAMKTLPHSGRRRRSLVGNHTTICTVTAVWRSPRAHGGARPVGESLVGKDGPSP